MLRPLLVLVMLSAVCWSQDPVKPEPVTPPAPKPDAKVEKPVKPAQPEKPVKLTAGDMLPKFKLTDLSGKEVSSEDLLKERKALVLDFWSLRCPACKDNEARFAACAKDFAEKGVAVVHIASNRGEVGDDTMLEALRAGVKKEDIGLPILIDRGNVVADLFGAAVTPTTYVIDAAGKIRYSGAITDGSKNRKVTVDYLTDALTAVLAGKDPEITTSRPEG